MQEEQILDLAIAENLEIDEQEAQEIMAVEVDENLELFPDVQELEVVLRTELIHDEGFEPLHDFEDVDLNSPFIVSSSTYPTDIEVRTKNVEMATPIVPTDSPTSIEEGYLASPLIVSSPNSPLTTNDVTEDSGVGSFSADMEDNAILSREASLPDLEDALLSDSESDSSSISSLSLPLPTFTIDIPPETHKASDPDRLSPISPFSSSPPLSPIYDATHIGLFPASEFIKKQQVHKRRDSQEALKDGEKYFEGVDELDDRGEGALDDGTAKRPSDDELEKCEDQKEDVVTYIYDKAAQGLEYLSKMSWTTTAAVIGVGIILSGALRAARRG